MKIWSMTSFAFTVWASAVAFSAQGQQQTPAPAPAQAHIPVRVIVVSLQDHKLALVEDGQLRKVYTVAVGKPSTPSPEGTFTIARCVQNPTYHHGDRTVLPGPTNPVGTRWMGLSKTGYGIHGTNEPKSIGKSASHGCIRMARADLEEFYALIAVGDQVQIIAQPDQQTASLFTAPASSESTTDLASTAPAQTQILTGGSR